MTRPTWTPGSPLPDGELWTTAMVAQWAKRSAKTIRRWGIPSVAPGLYDPAVVRQWIAGGHHR